MLPFKGAVSDISLSGTVRHAPLIQNPPTQLQTSAYGPSLNIKMTDI